MARSRKAVETSFVDGLGLLFFHLVIVGWACGCGADTGGGETSALYPPVPEWSLPADFKLGAHYYQWYPGNLEQGYLRGKLNPPQSFLFPGYESRDPRTAENHIEWAAEHGIDFFALQWVPHDTEKNRAIDEGFLRAGNLDRIHFCLFYGLAGVGYSEKTGAVYFDELATESLLSDVREAARKYFDHPSYLRIGGRPVLYLYTTRIATGRFKEAIGELRGALLGDGYDVFLIGDEIFWTVAQDSEAATVVVTDEPQVERIRAFDAITAYNLYESRTPEHGGYGAESTFIRDARLLLNRYRRAAPDVPLLPYAMPGYNDRGVRPDEDHYAIPRQWSPGAAEGSFLAEMFARVVVPFVDPRLPIAFITSWNEWNEDTGIEPLAPAEPTTRDLSASGSFFTQGYAYAGHGSTYLEVLSDLLRRRVSPGA